MKRTVRKPYQARLTDNMNVALLTHIRETADTIERAERMRDDNGLLLSAEIKRKRKLERNRGN